jgi:hypothetical protein
VSIEDQFLYEITGDEEIKINADYPSWYGGMLSENSLELISIEK